MRIYTDENGRPHVEGVDGAFAVAVSASVGKSVTATIWAYSPKIDITIPDGDVEIHRACPYCRQMVGTGRKVEDVGNVTELGDEWAKFRPLPLRRRAVGG